MPIRIAVTGDLGSGKSTVCGMLQSKYHLRVFSTGSIQRKIAVDKGMSTLDLNKYMEEHPEIDQQIDSELADLSYSENDIAIDSRMAWHFVRNTYKVFLTTDETIAARRVTADQRGPSEIYSGIQHAKEQLKARKASENYRYKHKYGVDCHDLRNYNLIIDTTAVSPEFVADLVMSRHAIWRQTGEKPSFWLSRYCLYPTRSMRNASNETLKGYCELIAQNGPVLPVDMLLSDGLFYIYDGHHRAAAFYRSQNPLVPCSLLAVNDGLVTGEVTADQYAEAEFSLAKTYEWEEYNGFRYFTYPR